MFYLFYIIYSSMSIQTHSKYYLLCEWGGGVNGVFFWEIPAIVKTISHFSSGACEGPTKISCSDCSTVYPWKHKWERAEAKIMLMHINDHSKDNKDITQNNKDEGLKHPSILPSVYLCLSTSGSWWGWSLSQLPWSKRWSGPRTGHQSVAALTQTTIPSHSYGHFRITNLTHTDHANSTQKASWWIQIEDFLSAMPLYHPGYKQHARNQ